LNIAHLFEKRENTERSVVGALIGTYDSQQYVYEATGCLPVMFEEDRDGALYVDKKLFATCLANVQLANPGEHVIGWYSTGMELNAVDTIFHDFFHQRAFHQQGMTDAQQRQIVATTSSVHLTVDATLHGSKIEKRAYLGLRFGVPDKPHGIMFAPLPVEVVQSHTELAALAAIAGTKSGANNTALLSAPMSEASPKESLLSFVSNIRQALANLQTQVDEIVAGRATPPPPDVGRSILALLNSLPRGAAGKKVAGSRPEGAGVDAAEHDVIVVSYLSALASAQMLLNQDVMLL